MRNIRIWMAFILCASALAFFWMEASSHAQSAMAVSGTVSMRYQEPSISAEDVFPSIKELLEKGEHLPDVTLWKENRGGQLEAGGVTGRASADVYQINGRGEDLWNAPFLQGSFPAKGDTAGCAVDRLVAHTLWGSDDVIGMALLWNGKEYTVRGVFNSGSEIAVIQTDDGDPVLFEAVELRLDGDPGAGDGAEAAQAFLQKMDSLASPRVTADLPLAYLGAGLFQCLPAWIFGIAGLGTLMAAILRARRGPILCAAAVLGGCAGISLLAWGGELSFSIPDRFIPTRWSDFSFWARQGERISSFLRQLLALGGTQRDTERILHLLACAGFTLLACFSGILFCLCAARFLMGGWSQLAAGCGLYLILTAALSLSFLKGEAPFLPLRAMFLSAPCWMGIFSLSRLWDWFLHDVRWLPAAVGKETEAL